MPSFWPIHVRALAVLKNNRRHEIKRWLRTPQYGSIAGAHFRSLNPNNTRTELIQLLALVLCHRPSSTHAYCAYAKVRFSNCFSDDCWQQIVVYYYRLHWHIRYPSEHFSSFFVNRNLDLIYFRMHSLCKFDQNLKTYIRQISQIWQRFLMTLLFDVWCRATYDWIRVSWPRRRQKHFRRFSAENQKWPRRTFDSATEYRHSSTSNQCWRARRLCNIPALQLSIVSSIMW